MFNLQGSTIVPVFKHLIFLLDQRGNEPWHHSDAELPETADLDLCLNGTDLRQTLARRQFPL